MFVRQPNLVMLEQNINAPGLKSTENDLFSNPISPPNDANADQIQKSALLLVIGK